MAMGFALPLFVATPAIAAQPVTGKWLTADGAALVEIAPCGGALCGQVIRVLKREPGTPTMDVNNPVATLRHRAIEGLTILSGFAHDGSLWRGRIYDPRSGKTYASKVSRNTNGTLKVQGCIAFLCQTQTWRAAG